MSLIHIDWFSLFEYFGLLDLPLQVFNIFGSILSIDNTHLYEKHKSYLLIATRGDVNGVLYLIAFAVVEE